MRRAILVVVALLLSIVPVGSNADAQKQFVLSPEDNNLWAYDADTGAAQLVVHAVHGDAPAGVTVPQGASPNRDINGQVCVSPDQTHVITGEDTVLGSGSSHDPRIAGWGYHEIHGDAIGSITTKQVGKLAPESGRGAGYTGDPDNYGCGFLDNNRLFTSAIGNTLPGEDANGQLFLWFGPFDSNFREVSEGSASFFVGDVDHCVIDDTIATAGGIAVDSNGDVYVASNRPNNEFEAGGIFKYSGTWPTSYAQCEGHDLLQEGTITKTRVIPMVPGAPADPMAPTASSVVINGHGTLYVSSVFTGTVSEFTKDGIWLGDVYPASPVAPRTGPTGQTPFGLALTNDGSLWIADLGIVTAAPAPGLGSVIKVPFIGGLVAQPLGETIQEDLTYPDGLGVYSP